MKAPVKTYNRLPYREHDLIGIPADIPDLNIEAGKRGIVRKLNFHNDCVTASVMVTYSTNQTRGWVDVDVLPDEKVISYTVLT